MERELRDEDGYVVNGKLALRSRRAIPPVQTTLRSGRNKTASPVEGNFSSFVTKFHHPMFGELIVTWTCAKRACNWRVNCT